MNSQLSDHSDTNLQDKDKILPTDQDQNFNTLSCNTIKATQNHFINVPIQTDNYNDHTDIQNHELYDDFNNIQINDNFKNNQNHSGFIDDNSQCNIKQNPVRTLFVSGLPMDVRERELYLLFQGFQVLI